MTQPESHMSPKGLTTVPKRLRTALGLSHGARLVWQQLPTGAMMVTVKHAYGAMPPPLATAIRGRDKSTP